MRRALSASLVLLAMPSRRRWIQRGESWRRRLAAWAVAACLCWLAAPAAADDAAMSRFHHEQGSRAYATGRFEQAVREFMTAQRLSPNPRTVYNIGLCFLRMSRHDDAFFFLDEYLASTDDAEGADERRRFARESLLALAPRVARVSVTSSPPGATIYVDQREHGSYGQTPRILALPPGPHRVWVELPGYREGAAEVTARVGEEVGVALAPARIVGSVTVRSPQGGQVRVLDASGATIAEGPAPLSLETPPGRVEIEVSAPGHRAHRSFASVVADESSELTVELDALPQPTGDLTVTSNVGDAVVELDDAPVGLAPIVLADLAIGTHAIRVTAPGHMAWAGDLDLEAATRSWLTVQLSPEPEGRTPWTWITGGAGAAALIAGAVLGGLALDRRSQFLASWNVPGGQDALALRDDARSLGIATDATLAVGIVGLAVGVALFFLTDDSGRAASSSTLTRRPR